MQNIVFQLVSANRRLQLRRQRQQQQEQNGNPQQQNDEDEDELPFHHISQYAPFYEIDPHWEVASDDLVSKIKQAHAALGRRIFNTHLRWDMLPQGNDASVKYIYVVRDGRDVLTSFYHHMTNQHVDDGGFQGDFQAFFQQFLEGSIAYGKWTHHLASWMPRIVNDDSPDKNPRILLVRYEDLQANLHAQVMKIATFLQLDDIAESLESAAEENSDDSCMDQVLERMTFSWMRQHQELFHPISVRWKPGYHFIRKGSVGDHDTIFDEQHKQIFMESIASDFGGSVPCWLDRFCLHG